MRVNSFFQTLSAKKYFVLKMEKGRKREGTTPMYCIKKKITESDGMGRRRVGIQDFILYKCKNE